MQIERELETSLPFVNCHNISITLIIPRDRGERTGDPRGRFLGEPREACFYRRVIAETLFAQTVNVIAGDGVQTARREYVVEATTSRLPSPRRRNLGTDGTFPASS